MGAVGLPYHAPYEPVRPKPVIYMETLELNRAKTARIASRDLDDVHIRAPEIGAEGPNLRSTLIEIEGTTHRFAGLSQTV